MEYNIDIIIAGCNTTCRHCYVNGGRAKKMGLDDFKLCIDKLSLIFSTLKDKITFTIDNELYNHPDCLKILEYVQAKAKDNYFHHGSTSGIAILRHKDQKEILDLLKRNKWLDVGLTIHGAKSDHDMIVGHEGAFNELFKAVVLFKKEGFKVWLSLMLNRKMLSNLRELNEILDSMPYDDIISVIPDYFPTPRLRSYQNLRLDQAAYQDLITFLHHRGLKTKELMMKVNEYSEESIIKHLDLQKIQDELTSKQMVFLHIDQDLDFYLGNTGFSLKKWGNIKDLSSKEILDMILSAQDNYYETGTIHYDDLLEAVRNHQLKLSRQNLVYPNQIAGIIAMIDNYQKGV